MAVKPIRLFGDPVLTTPAAPVETFDMDRAKAAMDTNFWGAFRTIQAVVPSMRERHTGVIINVLSVVARLPGAATQGCTEHRSMPSAA